MIGFFGPANVAAVKKVAKNIKKKYPRANPAAFVILFVEQTPDVGNVCKAQIIAIFFKESSNVMMMTLY